MRIDPEGREVSVRGRQVHMTPADIAAFLIALAKAIPRVRYFDLSREDEGRVQELSREAPKIPGGTWPRVYMFFEAKGWEPQLAPSSMEGYKYKIANFPQLHASITPSSFGSSVIEEVGRRITHSYDGSLSANHYADDKDGKRLIDKMFRVHRKMADNRTIVVDLRTGDFVREEKDYDWHGPDFAKQCHTKKDHYIGITYWPAKNIFWGHLPTR